MDSVLRRLLFGAIAGVIGLTFLLTLSCGQLAAQQAAERPTVTAAIVLREKDNVTLNRGAQDGLRKGDRLRVSHFINGRSFPTGTVVVMKVYGTTCIARVTEQSGALGPEDTATFEPATSAPAPAAPTASARKAVPAPTRKPVPEPVTTAPAEPTRKTTQEPMPVIQIEPARKPDVPLPLLPEFSGDKAAGAAFSLDFTNEGDKVLDTSAYRLSARLILDGQDYRTAKTTLTGSYNLAPGKSRTFSFNLTDFTVATDNDVWPLKGGRHTVTIRFGGKQYGPLTFEWHVLQ